MKYVSLFLLVVCACGKSNFTFFPEKVKTKFPEKLFGKWRPTELPQAILGPLAFEILSFHDGGFSAFRHSKTGDVWFTILMGQVFHIRQNQMQYCFGAVGVLAEQSPFEVSSQTGESITFCWRSTMRQMPTHAAGCSGCDCAKILISLTGKDTMDFKFWQSPPVLHAHFVMKRVGRAPTFAAVLSTMVEPYKQCDFKDKWGPNLPDPTLPLSNFTSSHNSSGCLRGVIEEVLKNKKVAEIMMKPRPEPEAGKGVCHKLNGVNVLLNNDFPVGHKYRVPDIKVQYIQPKLPCISCKVQYSVSADLEDDEYIALGFKGTSWEGAFPHPPEHPMRPCYFGMCVDEYDNYTSDRITVGYATSTHGSCVREMVITDMVGTPYDVSYKLTTKQSVKRVRKRTAVSFTIPQTWPHKKPFDGWFRTMWAIGKVSDGSGCDANINYHGKMRGMSPLNWLEVMGSTPCDYDVDEMIH